MRLKFVKRALPVWEPLIQHQSSSEERMWAIDIQEVAGTAANSLEVVEKGAMVVRRDNSETPMVAVKEVTNSNSKGHLARNVLQSKKSIQTPTIVYTMKKIQSST